MLKIKEICRAWGIKPSKRKGQNFLINLRVLEKIISAAELKKDDIVLEIGPGLGILTEELAKKAKKVIAVEIDKKFVEILKEKFKDYRNVEIIEGDILDLTTNYETVRKYELPPEIYRKISYFRKFFVFRSGYKIVANLPYNITGAVLRKFLSEEPKPSSMVLMLQKEVGERIIDKNNKRSIISLMVNFYGKPEIISYVSKNNFWPRPKVDSVILKITRIHTDRNTDPHRFFKFVRQGFSSPRKQLVNNLGRVIEKSKLKKILGKLKIDPKIRAEDLNLKDWLELYKTGIYGDPRTEFCRLKD